jgi:hypothetical protein
MSSWLVNAITLALLRTGYLPNASQVPYGSAHCGGGTQMESTRHSYCSYLRMSCDAVLSFVDIYGHVRGLSFLRFLFWRWKEQLLLKRLENIRLHGVTFQKTVIIVVTVAITSDLISLLNSSGRWALFEKLLVVQLVKKFSAFNGTWRFITVSRRAHCE